MLIKELTTPIAGSATLCVYDSPTRGSKQGFHI